MHDFGVSKVERARREARDLMHALTASDPELVVRPDKVTHRVKFPGLHTATDEEITEAVRSALDRAEGLTLYHHMPVCPYRCSYCHYPIVVQPGQEWKWVRLALDESNSFVDFFPKASELPVRSLYVGGGTPSLLSGEQASELVRHYRRDFRLTPNCEISFEGTPDTVSELHLAELRRAGVTRMSIGVQTLDDALLISTHRRHTAREAIQAVGYAQACGFEQVNADLIYGLPTQTPTHFRDDLERLVELQPSSITIYRLRLQRADELPTEMYRTYLVDSAAFPSGEDAIAMRILSRDILINAGYHEGPTGWFHQAAAPAQVYTDRWDRQVPLAAFGWWTYSYADSYEYYAHSDRRRYEEAVHEGRLPIAKAFVYSTEERIRRFFVFRMKGRMRVDVAEMDSRFGRSEWSRALAPRIDRLVADGLLDRDPIGFGLSRDGSIFIEELLDRAFE